MKILWVKPGGLVPLDSGGKIRSYHLLRGLAQSHSVTFLSFYAAHANDCHRDLEKAFHKVVLFPLQLPEATSLRNGRSYLRALWTSQPFSTARFCVPEVIHGVRRELEQGSYDAMICDFLMGAMVTPLGWPCPKIFFTHNVEALIWKRHFRVSGNPLWKLFTWREYRTIARQEKRCLRAADHVLTVSGTDRDFFSRIVSPDKITVIPTGVDVDYFCPQPAEVRPHSLVFTGSMDWMPNEDAVLYFIEEIFPLVRREAPDATLWVVGRRPSARLVEFAARREGVQVTGAVDDIRPYVAQSEVYVVPLRVGSGTRIKIFEALGMGKAVVSTTLGAEGLPVQNGENILLADEAGEFARRILDLFSTPERRMALGTAARRLVEEKYSWSSVATILDDVLRRVAPR